MFLEKLKQREGIGFLTEGSSCMLRYASISDLSLIALLAYLCRKVVSSEGLAFLDLIYDNKGNDLFIFKSIRRERDQLT